MRNHHIAIQGSVSSFHDLAAKKYFGEEITVLECGSFREVCEKLSQNLVDYGIIAIENKIAGSILLNYQLIDQFELNIIGEIYLPIELGLLTKKGAQLKDIKEIISHPMALGQCQDFLSTLENVKVSEFKDTATSAKLVKDQEGNDLAVIAGPAVAKEHDLDTVEENVCDEKQNFTRFYILSKGAIVEDQPDKASITLTTKNQIGSLSEVLGIIKDQGLNLTKIQSVPIPNNLSQYAFHLDIEFNNLERLETALSNLTDKVKSIKTLGLYKGQTIPV
ncbi:MAG: prephenate dehydratase [Flavobacteriia bacterium]|jgi:prephenate dehydratase